MLSIIEEMKEGPDSRPGLAAKFEKAKKNLLRLVLTALPSDELTINKHLSYHLKGKPRISISIVLMNLPAIHPECF